MTVDLSPDPSPTADLTDVEVVVDGTDVYVQIVGAGGLVLFRDAAGNWSAPKSQTSDDLIRASFQSPDHGFVLGPQFLVATPQKGSGTVLPESPAERVLAVGAPRATRRRPGA